MRIETLARISPAYRAKNTTRDVGTGAW